MKNKKEGVSLIIPSIHSIEIIKKCLGSAIKQKPIIGEILVIDDIKNSRDDLKNLCLQLGCKYLHSGYRDGGGSAARNIGLFAAEYKYIVYIDGDDYFYDEQSVNNLVKTLRECEVDLTWGDMFFGTYYLYKGERNFRRIVKEEWYEKKELYTNIHNCIGGSMIAHVNDTSKFVWIPGGTAADVRFIHNCMRNKVTYKRTPHIVSVCGRKSVYDGKH